MIDDSFNKKQYAKYFQHYLDSNIDEHVGGGTTQSRIALLNKYLPANSHIFEIGSGGGIDAIALQKAGYATDPEYADKIKRLLNSDSIRAVADASNSAAKELGAES